MTIQKVAVQLENRIETGAIQFGDDWPGLFIRGDDALMLGLLLENCLNLFTESDRNWWLIKDYLNIIYNEVKQ